jgi:cytochrome oxidase Cu insertion factor (SCO1/SenC/PrrC family)
MHSWSGVDARKKTTTAAAWRSLMLMTAPDFTLLDQAGEPWTLSDQRGSAVVLFFLRGDW